MSRRDRIVALFFLFLGGYVLRAGWALDVGTLQKPGPGFQPFALGLLFMVLAVAYLALALGDKRTTSSPWPLTLWKRPLIAAVGILLYWSCLTWFGFPATTFIFLLYWLWILERESWRRIALVSISATAGLYVVFTLILRIRLPMGTLF
jgi:hypothetical protein